MEEYTIDHYHSRVLSYKDKGKELFYINIGLFILIVQDEDDQGYYRLLLLSDLNENIVRNQTKWIVFNKLLECINSSEILNKYFKDIIIDGDYVKEYIKQLE